MGASILVVPERGGRHPLSAAEFAAFHALLSLAGLKPKPFQAVRADGAGVELHGFAISFGSAVAAVAAAIGAVCVAWIKAEKGRRVRFKIGDRYGRIEAEGHDVEEVKALIQEALDIETTRRARRATKACLQSGILKPVEN
jgi:hypothetical protein